MKIVFFGTSEFAVETLRALLASRHKVPLVVTQPDRKRGRRLVLSPPPVKVLAQARGIEVYQPQDASDAATIEKVKAVAPDLLVVVAFGQILKRSILEIPKHYCINIHGSLLPKYRGAAPTNWAIMNGETVSGVSLIRMNERMDAGDVIAQKVVPIDPADTNITLSETLADAGSRLLVDVANAIEDGLAIAFTAQDPAAATHAPKLRKEDGEIDWSDDAERIHDRVRGLLPWPGAYTHVGGKTLKVLETIALPSRNAGAAEPGTVVRFTGEEGLVVRTGKDDLAIRYVQLEGGKEMAVDAFLRGHRMAVGERFSSGPAK